MFSVLVDSTVPRIAQHFSAGMLGKLYVSSPARDGRMSAFVPDGTLVLWQYPVPALKHWAIFTTPNRYVGEENPVCFP